jgi:hypothetical protein
MPEIKSNEKLYKHICEKYPDVHYYEGEDLSIENMKGQYIKRMWDNKDKYKHVSYIAYTVGLSDRTVYRIAKELNLRSRKHF